MSANTNADVAAMIDLLNETWCGHSGMHERHHVNPDGPEAAALIQSQQAEITRLSAMVEERGRVIRDYMSDCSNDECERCISARQAISTQEPTP